MLPTNIVYGRPIYSVYSSRAGGSGSVRDVQRGGDTIPEGSILASFSPKARTKRDENETERGRGTEHPRRGNEEEGEGDPRN